MMLGHNVNIHSLRLVRLYLDPGTGSPPPQLPAATVMGTSFIVATSRHKVKRSVRGILKGSTTQEDDPTRDERIGHED